MDLAADQHDHMYLPEKPQEPLPTDCCGTGMHMHTCYGVSTFNVTWYTCTILLMLLYALPPCAIWYAI